MTAVLVWLVLGFGDYDDLSQENRYFLNNNGEQHWIENSKREKIADLEKYSLYETELRIDQYDDGRRVRMVSRLGFALDNIPLYNNRFYNECIEIFLEAERLLPRAYQILKKNNFQAREVATCQFSFPDQPVIDVKGFVKFREYQTCSAGHDHSIWIWGKTPLGGRMAVVTLGAKADPESVVVHEYIHMSGYNGYHKQEHFKFCRREVLLQDDNVRCP